MQCLKIKRLLGIFCAMGGFNSNSTFDYLDFEVIKNNPKIICGYSDPTSLINVIYAKTGLVTFHGPNFKTLSSIETDYGYKEVKKRFIENDLRLGTDDDEYIVIKKRNSRGQACAEEIFLYFQI